MKKTLIVMTLIAASFSAFPAWAQGNSGASVSFELPLFISSNMVIQRDKEILFWGWGTPGRTVKAGLNNGDTIAAGKAVVDQNGRWRITLPKKSASEDPSTLVFEVPEDNVSVTLTNILIGDVWFISGQSNLEKKITWVTEKNSVLADAKKYKNIRSFKSGYNVQYSPQERISSGSGTVSWIVCDNEKDLSSVSAVGYYFAKNLYLSENIPIGLLQAYHGGTEIETWLRPELIQNDPALAMVKARALNPWPKSDAKAYAYHHSVNYNGHTNPMVGIPVKGILWYQGTSNTKRALEYFILQKKLIEDYRQIWGQGELPFAICQLYDVGSPSGATNPLYEESEWADLREGQLKIWKEIPGVSMAVICDTNPDPNNSDESLRMHPQNSVTVGNRLAMAVLQDVYGRKVAGLSPTVKSYKISGSKVTIQFADCGTGLKSVDGKSLLKGFVVAGADKAFKAAGAVFVGPDTIEVSSPDVLNPVTVRYGWAKNPDCNLYNSEDLPASPFRLDGWSSLIVYP